MRTYPRRKRWAHVDEQLINIQREVALCIERGLSNEQIGAEVGISPRTAKAHSDASKVKLGVTKRRLIPAALRAREGRG
jgi:DNA-binding NarL/FixJ family response regulator